jgi:hypothetical protein
MSNDATKEEMQLMAVAMIGLTIVAAVKAAGPLGVPGGTIYAGLMGHGCTLSQFENLMSILLQSGKIIKKGQLYVAP